MLRYADLGWGGGRQVTVKEGDTLTGIAYAEYGDSNNWRRIADANHLWHRRFRQGGRAEGTETTPATLTQPCRRIITNEEKRAMAKKKKKKKSK